MTIPQHQLIEREEALALSECKLQDFKLPRIYSMLGASTTTQRQKVCNKLEQVLDITTNVLASSNPSYQLIRCDAGHELTFSRKLFTDELGKIMHFTERKQLWLGALLIDNGLHPYIKIINTGTKGQYSMVELTAKLIHQFNGELAVNYVTPYFNWIVECSDAGRQAAITPIDMKSLQNYISDPMTNKFPEHRVIAQRIKNVAAAFDGKLPQIVSKTASSRTYYEGINLQTCPKVVRHAALGDCWEYDLNTAAQALAILRVAKIYEDDGVTVEWNKEYSHTFEYIRNKQYIRQWLANDIFRGNKVTSDYAFQRQVNDVKTIITAIGFGAKLLDEDASIGAKLHSSICKVFQTTTEDGVVTNSKAMTRALENKWLQGFAAEQNKLQRTIVDDWKKRHHGLLKTEETKQFFHDKANRFSDSRIASQIFQADETEVMDIVRDFIQAQGKEVLLNVHDAVYVSEKIDITSLQDTLVFSLVPKYIRLTAGNVLSVEQTQIKSWLNKVPGPDAIDVDEHRAHIAFEERACRGYESDWNEQLTHSQHQQDDFLSSVIWASKVDDGYRDYVQNFEGDESDIMDASEYKYHVTLTGAV